MALDITTQDIIIDETTGLQDDDVNPSVLPHSTNATLQYLLSRDGAGGLTSPEVAFQTNFVQATASAGETITSVVLTQNASGTPFSTTVGVNSGLQTVDGNYVWLFQDPTHPNVVIGVIGTSDPFAEPAETGPLAFSFALISTSTTNADLYTVQYVPLHHPDATNPDDQIDLTDKVFASVTGTSTVSFTGENAHPGSNEFNLLSSPDDASKQLVVTGLVRSSQLDPNSALVNSECNVSQQGFGVDNQSIQPDTDGQNQPLGREVLQIDFVTGGTPSAGDGADIAYGSHLENITQAGFIINQLTPSQGAGRADISISAFNVQGNEQGSDFFNGSPTNPVDITSLTLTGASALSTITADGTYATPSGNVTVTGLSGTGNKVTITGLDNTTTVDITTSGFMDRLHIESVDSNEGIDITEVHFSAQTTNAHNEEVGSFINFDDDGPTMTAIGVPPELTVDETNLLGDDSANFSTFFSSNAGADGDAISYALGISPVTNDSGLTDTATGQSVLLFLEGGNVVGRAGSAAGAVVFTVSVSAAGVVTLDQARAIVHADATNPDDSRTLAAADLVTLTATITDGDGDQASATHDIGQNLNFEDDGPSISTTGTEPTLTVDETVATNATQSFAANFSSAFGADGAGTVTYALGVTAGATGLVDTLTGEVVVLSVNGGVVEGRTAGTNDLVFTVSVNAAGSVTLDQIRAVVHPNANDPDDSTTLAADNLVQLTATITDKDGDHQSATLDIGRNLVFEDDGPTITVPFDGDQNAGNGNGTHETLANALNASATGAFGYDIGADAHTAAFYTGGGSDFVDQNGALAGVQIGLSGTITGGGGGNVLTPNVTLASESLTSATFNFTFTYDKDPAAGVQTGTAGGTLVFDKAADTYTVNLTDPLEGFSFDVIHTSELLSKEPTGNTGHPQIVVERLQADDPNTPDDEDFYVQFTGNAINNANPFRLTNNGEGSSADAAFTVGGHEMVSNNNETWVSATQSTNGVAGDTIQKDELLTLRFFNSNVGIQTEATTPTATAGAMAIKFDGIGNSEDLMLILDLIDKNGADNIAGTADDNSTITRAVYVSNADIFKTGQVPAPYSSEFTLDNNDGLVIIEQNDYNAAGEDYVMQGAQIMQSGNGITGNNAAIDLNRTTGAGGGSNATTNLVNFDATDNDVLKITDIAFTSTVTQTPDANLDFAFQVADADADQTAMQHILVDVA
ncbi:DUF5801 domain-containing protein [Phyllobacterium sp. LjRoot231]|uniref:DUF5801 repeats-in-toxin domain-containing protein n=1 Tax=Phyllobacterium sp. LjRoot231 TaxID=3342289 RepID=UPI003ED1748A